MSMEFIPDCVWNIQIKNVRSNQERNQEQGQQTWRRTS